jgi:hypothetical protein
MAGCVNRAWSGSIVATDALLPFKHARINAGAMSISDAVVGTIAVTGTITLAVPPYVPGPDIHVWIPFGPISVAGPATGLELIRFPLGAGTWMVSISMSGTGLTLGVSSQFFIESTVISDGNTLSIPTGSIRASRETRDSVVMTSTNTYATIVGVTDIDGYANVAINIDTPVNSNWSGYITCVGSPVSV